MNNNALYHALRIAYCCGKDGVGWHYVLDVLREGCGYNHTRTLSPHITLPEQVIELREEIKKIKGEL